MSRRPDVAPPRPEREDHGLVRSKLAPLLIAGYRFNRARPLILRAAVRFEQDRFQSSTLRAILARFHGVQVGAYSYGTCLVPGACPPGVTFGRYVSVAADVKIFRRSHPLANPSLHPYFYNPALGVVTEDVLPSPPLYVAHDSWIGERSIIVPGCERIGVGAVVTAGAVVTRDVPDFVIVAGSPARKIGERFTVAQQRELLASKWWERSIDELKHDLPRYTARLYS